MPNEVSSVSDERSDSSNLVDKQPAKSKPKAKIVPSGIIAKLRSIKHIEIIIAVIVIVVMVLAYTSFVGNKDKVTVADNLDSLTQELQSILGSIKGVGEAKVLIVYRNGSQVEVESGKSSQDKSSIFDDDKASSKPSITSEIDGVIVVADGGGDAKVRITITQALSKLLNLDYNKIQVFEKTA